jgi:hypothetical protein
MLLRQSGSNMVHGMRLSFRGLELRSDLLGEVSSRREFVLPYRDGKSLSYLMYSLMLTGWLELVQQRVVHVPGG